MLKIVSEGLSHVGMRRTQNEDHYLVNDDLKLYMVADGMGGHLGGEFASKMAVTTVEEVISQLNSPEATQIHGVNSENDLFGERLRFAIQEASRRIYEQSLYDETLKGMGTTSVAVLIDEDKAYIAHVGDSRAYLIREQKIKQLTEDHSLVTEQLKAGVITAAEVKKHRFKNVITRSVGYQEEVESDLALYRLKPQDYLVLCSDGLSNLVEDEEILSIVSQNPLKQSCQLLIECANGRGGDDNVTVVIVQLIEK